MAKILILSPEKCTNCGNCEQACSSRHEIKPARSSVSVLSWEKEGLAVPIMCLQCGDAACAKVCPAGAITRDDETGAIVINQIKCIKCQMCVNACPFGSAGYDSVSGLITKCDLCNGDPACARSCESGAIAFREENIASLPKKRLLATKFKNMFVGMN